MNTYQFSYPCFGGALIGATIVGSYMSGEPALDVLTTFNGALGAAVGFTAGSMLAMSDTPPMWTMDKNAAYMLGGAILVPAAVNGALDRTTIALGVGAYVGAQLMKSFVYPKMPKEKLEQ